MGIILNKTIPNNAENLERLSPNDATWVTAHADISGLAVVEIERLWKRFQQINNSNTKTTINIDQVATNAFGNDIFVRNVRERKTEFRFRFHCLHDMIESSIRMFLYKI